MKTRLFGTRAILSLTTMFLCSLAQAQLVTYEFTGTVIYDEVGNAGQTVTGVVTLDPNAVPVQVIPIPSWCGEFASWSGGGFSIDIGTDSGLVVGSASSEITSFVQQDFPCLGTGFVSQDITTSSQTPVGELIWHSSQLGVWSQSNRAEDGIATVVSQWDPLSHSNVSAGAFSYIHDVFGNLIEVDYLFDFTIDSVTQIGTQTNIIIAGCDSGVADFEFNGVLASKLIDDCAVGAKNHGKYVSAVAKLTNAFNAAGLITDAQKDAIMSCAAQSGIGKK